MFPKVNERDSDLFSERKEKEKKTFDAKTKQLPVLFVGSCVSYLNSDMKSWSIGTMHARSHDDRSYEILTENGNLISRNCVHLRSTNVQPVDKMTMSYKANASGSIHCPKPVPLMIRIMLNMIMVKM